MAGGTSPLYKHSPEVTDDSPRPLCQEMIGYGGPKQFSTQPPTPPLHLNPTFLALAPKTNLTGLYFPPIPFYIEPGHIKMLVLLNSFVSEKQFLTSSLICNIVKLLF